MPLASLPVCAASLRRLDPLAIRGSTGASHFTLAPFGFSPRMCSTKRQKTTEWLSFVVGGAYRARTRDLLTASHLKSVDISLFLAGVSTTVSTTKFFHFYNCSSICIIAEPIEISIFSASYFVFYHLNLPLEANPFFTISSFDISLTTIICSTILD